MKLLSFFILCLSFFLPFTVQAASCDQWITETVKPKGVVLLGHGLNLLPSKMLPWAKALAKEGYEVFLPAFTGHCNDQEKFLSISAKDWQVDLDKIYLQASERANRLKVPLFLVAYSFSALLFQTNAEKFAFDKKIFLSPALATKFWYPWVILVAGWFPDFTYSTMNLPDYAANKKSSSRAVLALDEYLKKWNQGSGKDDRTPILVWADKADELVNYDGLQTIVADKNNWNLERIDNKESTLKKPYHHLIIDSAAVGEKTFQLMIKESLEFFK
ncbi:MAG: alpha/beta hydrolase [Oligoflexia bacterium]|nr:alpha/beta hydrolase [Oligoflexia bacterium]